MRLLGGAQPEPADQEAHNRHHDYAVVTAVVLMLLLYMYLFTRLHQYVHLPSPRAIAEAVRIAPYFSFERGGYLYPRIQATYTGMHSGNVERMILFAGVMLAFLLVYFAPFRAKRGMIAVCFLVLMSMLYARRIVASFTCVHLAAYLCFHAGARGVRWVAFTAGALAVFGFGAGAHPATQLALALATGTACACLYARFCVNYLVTEHARWIRLAVSQSALLAVGLGVLLHGVWGRHLSLPVGVMFFLMQWIRLMLYAADFHDGRVPRDLDVGTYLSVFMTPALLPNWGWGVAVAQSYQYQAGCFLARDKNAIILDGVRLLGVAVLYFVFGRLLLDFLAACLNQCGVTVYTRIPTLLQKHLVQRDAGTATILFSCLMHEMRWLLRAGGIFHFLVGLWRLFGYDVAQHIRLPLLATNLVSVWARLMYHYREFLVRLFYYPVFLRMTGYSRRIRVLVATMAAAGCANWLWGVMPEKLMGPTIRDDMFLRWLRSWPYFLLLGAGIAVTELWLLWRGRRRRPWTPGWRLILDVCAVYATFQYYTLINLFYYVMDRNVVDGTLADFVMMFLRGLGF